MCSDLDSLRSLGETGWGVRGGRGIYWVKQTKLPPPLKGKSQKEKCSEQEEKNTTQSGEETMNTEKVGKLLNI